MGRGTIFGSNKGLRVASGLMARLDAKGLITAPEKRVEGAGSPGAKRGDVINEVNKSKKTDAVCSTGIGGRIIFGPDKGLKVADGPMARLGASAALNKIARPNADCLPDKKRGLSPKPEKWSKGTWRPGGKGSV